MKQVELKSESSKAIKEFQLQQQKSIEDFLDSTDNSQFNNSDEKHQMIEDEEA